METDKKIKPFVYFKLTEKCNYNCEYCTQELRVEKDKSHLTNHANDKVINNFIEIIKNLEDQWEIKLLGGEALVHPRFFELVEKIISIGHLVHITTNFSFPIETYKKLIDICGENLISISASIHLSQISSIDDFINKAIEFNNYKYKQTNFVVVSVLNEENFELLKDLKERFNTNDIKLKFLRLIINKKTVKYSKKIEDYLDQNPEQDAKQVEKLKGKNMFGTICHAGYKSFNIEPNGSVKRCYTYQGPLNKLGHIEKNSLELFKKPMPCLSKDCKCCNVILKNNLIELNHKNYLKVYNCLLLSKVRKITEQIKKKLHSVKILLTQIIK